MASVKKNYIYNTLMIVTNALFPLITVPYLSRTLGPEGYGKIGFALSIIGYFSAFSGVVSPIYGLREIARHRDDREKVSRIFSELFILNLVAKLLALVAYIGFLIFAATAHKDLLLFIIVGLVLLFEIVNIDWLYQGFEKYGYITLRNLIFKGLSLVLLFVFVHQPKDYIWYGVASVFAMSGPLIINFFLKGQYADLNLRDIRPFSHFSFLGTFFVLGAVSTAFANIDKVLLGFLKGSEAVGYYSLADKMWLMSVSFSSSLITVLLPRVTYHFANGELDMYYTKLRKAFQFTMMISLPLTTGLIFFAKDIVLVFGSQKFLASVPILSILALNVVANSLTNFMGNQILIVQGKERLNIFSIALSLIVAVFLIFILVPQYGSIGAALGVVLAYGVQVLFLFVVCRKEMSRILLNPGNLRYLLAPAFMLGGLMLARKFFVLPWHLLQLLVSVLFGGVIWGMVLILTRDPLVWELFGMMRNIVRRSNK